MKGLGQPPLDHDINGSDVERSISGTSYSRHGRQADPYTGVERDSGASLPILKIEFNGDYVTLLDSLEHVMMELRGQVRQEQHRQKRKHKQLQFNHGTTNISLQKFPNVATGSRKPVTTTTRQSSTLKDYAGPVTADIGLPTRDKLKQDVERCGNYHWRKPFIVNSDERSETVYPDEINHFFTFQKREEITNFNLMPLLFSFIWPSMTLVLHSSFTSLALSKSGNQQSNMRVRWPLRRDHDHVILPCCFERHWTLFDVDLKHNVIREYDSVAGDVSKSRSWYPPSKSDWLTPWTDGKAKLGILPQSAG